MPTHRPPYDYARALRFIFEDPGWVHKILLGAFFTLLSVFFIGSIWVSGYTVRIVRRTVGGERPPLPEWNNWGELFRDGLRATVVWLAHVLPLMLLAVLLALALGGAGTILSSSLDTSTDFQTVLFLMVLTGTIFFSLVGLAILLYLPAAFLRFVILDRVSAAFDFRENIAFIRRNMNSYFQALLVFSVASFIAQFGLIVLCIGFFPAAFWSVCVFGYAMGELALEEQRNSKQ
jgi:heme exporter protein D